MSLIKVGMDLLISTGKEQPDFDASLPLETNPIPIIYGRPGWQVAIPVRVHRSGRRAAESISVAYVVSEGVQRIPDALMIAGLLDAYSDKYKSGDLTANLAQLAERASGDAESGYGFKVAEYGRFHHGFPAGRNFDDENDVESVEGRGLGLLGLSFNVRDSHKYTSGALPEVQYLPNGQMLHDPRIEWNSDANYLIPWDGGNGAGNTLAGWPDDIDFSIAQQIPRAYLGGVFKGWSSENHDHFQQLDASRAGRGYQAAGYRYGGEPYDVELGDTPDNNPALVVIDYLTAVYGAAIPVSDINQPSIVDSANYCDASAPTYAGGPGQPQMACDIAIDTSNKIRDNLTELLKTCRGKLGWIDGQYHLKIRKAGAPVTFEIEPRHIKSRKSLEYGTKDKRYNRAIGTYVEPRNQYKQRQVAYPSPQSVEYLQWVEDDGEVNEKEINLTGCSDIYRAADLLSTHVKESRASIRAVYVCTLELLEVTIGDVVTITDDKFLAKRFWVDDCVFDPETWDITLSVIEHDDTAYDNLTHPAELPAPGVELLPDTARIPAVADLAFVSESQIDSQTAGQLTWEESDDQRVQEYIVQLFRSGESAALLSYTASVGSQRLPYLEPGDYVASVIAKGDLFRSDPAQLSITVAYADMPLADIAGLQLAGGGSEYQGNAVFSITPESPEADWFAGYRWRIYAGADLVFERTTQDPELTYPLSENLKAGGNRTIRCNVCRVAISGQLGAAAEVEVTQPAPASPAGITVTPGIAQLDIKWRSDFRVAVYVSTEGGFTPAAENRVFDGVGGAVLLTDLQADTPHYIVLQSFDEFGPGPLSGELQTATLADPVPAALDQLNRLDGGEDDTGSVKNLVSAERKARQQSEQFSAAVQAVLGAHGEVQGATIRKNEETRQTEHQALTHQVELAQSRIGDNESAILQEQQTRASETGSLSTEMSLLRAQVNARPTFASGFEAGQDWSRWSVVSGAFTAETSDIYAGLQSALLAGTVSAAIPQPSADEFAGRQIRLGVYAKAAGGNSLELRYQAGSYDSGWQAFSAPSDWESLTTNINVPADQSGMAATVQIRAVAGSVKIDRLLLEDVGSELPEITAEINRISTAQADLESSVAGQLQTYQASVDSQLSVITEDVQAKVDSEGVETIIDQQLEARQYDDQLAAISLEQTALSSEQGVQAEAIEQINAVTGADQANIANRSFTIADEVALAAAVAQVQQAHNELGAAEFAEYRRTAIGYCVDADGNPTDHETAVACVAAGYSWVTAPLAEAISKSRITLPDGTTGAAGELFQVLTNDVGELTARAALYVDANGRIAGVFVEGSDTATSLDIIADAVRIRTQNGHANPFTVEGDDVVITNAKISSSLDIGGLSIIQADGHAIFKDAELSGVLTVGGNGDYGLIEIGGAVPLINLKTATGLPVGTIGYQRMVALPDVKNPQRLITLGGDNWSAGLGLVSLDCDTSPDYSYAALEIATNAGKAINTDGSICCGGLIAADTAVDALTVNGGLEVTGSQVLTASASTLDILAVVSRQLTTEGLIFPDPDGYLARRAKFPQGDEGMVWRSQTYSSYKSKLAIFSDGKWHVIQTSGNYSPGDYVP